MRLSGVGRLLLIDVGNDGSTQWLMDQFDLTTLSSLNRHACATLDDVGSPKVIGTQKFLKKIAPWAQYVLSPFRLPPLFLPSCDTWSLTNAGLTSKSACGGKAKVNPG